MNAEETVSYVNLSVNDHFCEFPHASGLSFIFEAFLVT
jgi:hypothetical protein